MKTVEIADFKAIFESPGYQHELEELNSYAANIKQERPIIWMLAKYLRRAGFVVALEKNKIDLVVGETRIEAKYNFEFELVDRLNKELDRVGWDLNELIRKRDILRAKKKSTTQPRAVIQSGTTHSRGASRMPRSLGLCPYRCATFGAVPEPGLSAVGLRKKACAGIGIR